MTDETAPPGEGGGGGGGGSGLDGLSARELAGLYRSIQAGTVTETQVDAMLAAIPTETKQQAVMALFTQHVVPHFDDVKTRAESSADSHTVRDTYASLPDDRQQEIFNTAVSDIIGALFTLRERPVEALLTLKGLLRDPFTVEGLLLIFDNEEMIDPAYSAQMKEYAATHLTWAGCALMPEAYDRATVETVADQLGVDLVAARERASALAHETS
jgi:hypothetical protein